MTTPHPTRHPLYPDTRAPVEHATPEPPVTGGWDGEPGGILVVGEAPTRLERSPFTSDSGAQLRAQVARLAKGTPVAWDYAFRTPGAELTGKAADRDLLAVARAQLHHTITQVRPTRILAMGGDAHKVLSGISVQASVVRKGYGFLADGTPVYYLPRHWGPTATNRILRRQLDRDLEHALSTPTPPTPFGGTWSEVLTPEDAELAWADLSAAGQWVYDTETVGPMGTQDFRIVILAAAAPGSTHAWVWSGSALDPGDPRAQVILRLMDTLPAAGHNLKYDELAMHHHFGRRSRVARDCTRLLAKLRRADGPAGLDPQAALVGMGGHKREAGAALKVAKAAITKLRTECHADIVIEWATEPYTTKGGAKRTRKVPVARRPPSDTEVLQALDAAWVAKRTMGGTRTSMAEVFPGAPMDIWTRAIQCTHTEPATWAYGLMDPTVAKRYCARDVVTTAQLLPYLRGQIALDPGLTLVWDEILSGATQAVAGIELAGVPVDLAALRDLEGRLDRVIQDSLAVIRQYAPPDFSPDSAQQLAAFLFQPAPAGLGLPPGGLTKTGQPQTDKATLGDLVGRHPVVQAILDYKTATKLQSNYARGMRPHVRVDGRVHCTLNIDGAESGRASSSDPNMQVIVSKGPWAKPVKRVFAAPPGYRLIQLDYKTLELVVAAALSGEETMIDVFRAGGDLHRQTAIDNSQAIWGHDFHSCGLGYTFFSLLQEHGMPELAEHLLVVDQDPGRLPGAPKPGEPGDPRGWVVKAKGPDGQEQYTLCAPDGRRIPEPRWARLVYEQGEKRKAAKGVAFAVLYGQGAETMAEQWGISVELANSAQDAIMGRRKKLQAWIREQVSQCRKTGHARTWWRGQPARIRPLPDIGSGSGDRRGHAERAAVNTPVQGTGSDYCMASVVTISRQLEESGLDARIVLTVHDSILLLAREDHALQAARLARDTMVSWPSSGVPIAVDVEWGPTWGDLEPLRL